MSVGWIEGAMKPFDYRKQRRECFVLHKIGEAGRLPVTPGELASWLEEYEELIAQYEREWHRILIEHMETCVKPLVMPRIL